MDQWPRARNEPPIQVTLKAEPGDFRVDEVPGFEPTGDGEHLLVRLEKTGLGTPELAAELARLHGIPRLDVGYAGLKDRHAVTCQWFSLRGVARLDDAVTELPGVRVLETARHSKKLKPGSLRGNRFVIRLRAPGSGDAGEVLAHLADVGAPNYFGAQRFGRDNLAAARSWLPKRRRVRTSRFRSGLYLSVLRSFLFNEVLAARVREGSWASLVEGDVQAGGGPSGPLWGRGRSPVTGHAARVESAALEPHGDIRDGLEHAGLNHERRAMVLSPSNLDWHRDGGDLVVSFFLGAGAYATSLLREGFQWDPEPGARAA